MALMQSSVIRRKPKLKNLLMTYIFFQKFLENYLVLNLLSKFGGRRLLELFVIFICAFSELYLGYGKAI